MKTSLSSITAFVAIASVLSAAPVSEAVAADFSFAGDLPSGNHFQPFVFEVATLGMVTLRTWSYAGGTSAASTVVAAGGFDPIVSLFDGAGKLLHYDDDGGTDWDSLISTPLVPGTYSATITKFSAFPSGMNLSDGFRPQDSGFGSRDSHWALDITNVESASQSSPMPIMGAIPEPQIYWLMSIGLGLIGLAAQRKKTNELIA